jgi:uncharacterized protein (TIRG00374 family)
MAAVAIVVLDRVANAYRWLLLLRAVEPTAHLPFGTILRVFFVSGFIGSFLPGSVGGDAVRTYALVKLRVQTPDALASVLVDRLLGTASVLLMAAGGLLVVRGQFATETVVTIVVAGSLGLALGLLVLFDERAATAVTGVLTRWRLGRLARVAARLLAAIRQFGRTRGTLTVVLGLSLGVQALRTLQAWTLGRSLGLEVGLIWYFAFVPVAILVMLLPTSVAGLGTGAVAFQLLFGTLGVSAADAYVLALLFSALSIVGNVPGGILFATDRLPRRA